MLRKGNKPLGVASSCSPVCLLNTMEKLLEELILQRLQTLLVGENGLLENHFGFRKGRSTVDAIQVVVNIATNAKKGTGKCKGFCVLTIIDIRNAFNAARWKICIEAMVQKKVPDYLLRMIDDYLTDRWVIYQDNKWSRVGALVWNAMYNDFLRFDLPAVTNTIGIADDALVMCAAEDVRILEDQ